MKARVYLNSNVERTISSLRSSQDVERIGILVGKRLNNNKFIVEDIVVPTHKSNYVSVEVIDYTTLIPYVTKVIGWCHGGGAHFYHAFHSFTDVETSLTMAKLCRRPIVSICFSRDSYDCRVFTPDGKWYRCEIVKSSKLKLKLMELVDKLRKLLSRHV